MQRETRSIGAAVGRIGRSLRKARTVTRADRWIGAGWLAGAVVCAVVLATGDAGAATEQVVSSAGDGAGNELGRPSRVRVGPDGSVYVAGAVSSNVLRYASDGTVSLMIGSAGDGAGASLEQAEAISVDTAGVVCVAGRLSENILCRDAGGVVHEVVDFASQPLGSAIAGSPRDLVSVAPGTLYVAGGISNNVVRVVYNPSTFALTDVTTIVDHTGVPTDPTTVLTEPVALAMAPASGDLFVAGAGSDNVLRVQFDASTGDVDTISLVIGASGAGAGKELSRPSALAVDSVGLVYVAGFSSDNVLRADPALCLTNPSTCVEEVMDSSGNRLTNKFAAFLSGPDGLAFNSAGELYVSGRLSNNVFIHRPGGFLYEAIDSEANGSVKEFAFSTPGSMAVDSDDEMFLAAGASNNLIRFTGKPLEKQQQACVSRLNKLYNKLIVLHLKHQALCITGLDRAPAGYTREQCFADPGAFGKNKIEKRVNKQIQRLPKQCPFPPHFGPSTVQPLADAAAVHQVGWIHDVFGADFDAASLVGAPGGDCQFDVIRQLQSCQKKFVGEFFRCKKNGMKGKTKPKHVPVPEDSPFDSVDDLLPCIGFDPKGKISGACGDKLRRRLDRSCGSVSFASVFPGECSAAAGTPALVACLQDISECRGCRGANGADLLDRNCDEFAENLPGGVCPN